MAYLKIKLSVSKYADSGRTVHPRLYSPSDKLKQEVLKRDKNRCRYCGFESEKYQEVQYIGEGRKPKVKPSSNMKLENYTTICPFCYQCFHLEKIDRMQSGAVIWLPEIGQAALNHVVRAIYVSRLARGPVAEAAKDSLTALLSRKDEAKRRLGTDSPAILGSIMDDFLEVREYKARLRKLKSFRILPLDRRIIMEGELEFNQFPQMLAYWRSKDGPFGDLPAKDWLTKFVDLTVDL